MPETASGVPIFCQQNFGENFDKNINSNAKLKMIWSQEIGKIYRDLIAN